MPKRKIQTHSFTPLISTSSTNWNDWKWQMKNAFRSKSDFSIFFDLSEAEEKGFSQTRQVFKTQTTPYYASLIEKGNPKDPIRATVFPTESEGDQGLQQQLDPLGETKNSPTSRIVHRYPDRALFLVTDICSIYCRYCTRKHFTGKDQAVVKKSEYQKALDYLKSNKKIKEVILSGGDPLTLSNERLEVILNDLHKIENIEIIRIGSRIPATMPMRIDEGLILLLKKYKPIYLMSHFNHPNEITEASAQKLELLVDNGVPILNQMVLLNGVNNHAAIVQALSRRLIYLRVKPYYMFQCDPSIGTDHLRTPVQQSLAIQKELWGNLSGIAMPNLCLDIPSGGGKVGLTPNFLDKIENNNNFHFTGWDGVQEVYKSPARSEAITPYVHPKFQAEWDTIKGN